MNLSRSLVKQHRLVAAGHHLVAEPAVESPLHLEAFGRKVRGSPPSSHLELDAGDGSESGKQEVATLLEGCCHLCDRGTAAWSQGQCRQRRMLRNAAGTWNPTTLRVVHLHKSQLHLLSTDSLCLHVFGQAPLCMM